VSCTKVGYRTRKKALKALASQQQSQAKWGNQGMRAQPKSAYHCPDCLDWHLTSKRYEKTFGIGAGGRA
jgi:hypothetical protein